MKKAKISESRSFLVRYRRTYVLNNKLLSFLFPRSKFDANLDRLINLVDQRKHDKGRSIFLDSY